MLDAALVNKLVPCYQLLSSTSEMWSLSTTLTEVKIRIHDGTEIISVKDFFKVCTQWQQLSRGGVDRTGTPHVTG